MKMAEPTQPTTISIRMLSWSTSTPISTSGPLYCVRSIQLQLLSSGISDGLTPRKRIRLEAAQTSTLATARSGPAGLFRSDGRRVRTIAATMGAARVIQASVVMLRSPTA